MTKIMSHCQLNAYDVRAAMFDQESVFRSTINKYLLKCPSVEYLVQHGLVFHNPTVGWITCALRAVVPLSLPAVCAM